MHVATIKTLCWYRRKLKAIVTVRYNECTQILLRSQQYYTTQAPTCLGPGSETCSSCWFEFQHLNYNA